MFLLLALLLLLHYSLIYYNFYSRYNTLIICSLEC
ncbi:unnamed protein product [Spirodela intermedia]|uniref:Uncharacterized protein n=1 Tax=Spirodela intermedia TaxID=51605 RepID=A0ABN7EBP8_SPIIN|nr:unnamed protein product [Spirodela intermedia]